VANRAATNCPKNKPKLDPLYGNWKYNSSLNQNIFKRKRWTVDNYTKLKNINWNSLIQSGIEDTHQPT
jgi:hypothetical protein